MIELKNTPTTLMDVDASSRRVEIRLAEHLTVDSHNDRFQKGAWAKTISESSYIPFLWNHDASKIPAGLFDVKEFREDEFGLRGVAKLDNNRTADEILDGYKSGSINQHSVGFYTMQKKMADNGVRIITEAKLVEGSAVVFGSNPNTPFLGFKSADPLEVLEEIKERSERFTKAISVGNLTDEARHRLAIEHAIITKSLFDINESLKAKEPEVISTPELVLEPVVDMKMRELAELSKAWKNIK
ncbi:HK97 family phage prohead protease [Hymenobacter sublimis]|uniref:HK97 family phage prohead protease n=1 Tax=Hymenobacter sublimis TaxID=2933777 RepID=A0ABY4JFF7_9BACT|nr:HK97 family phage prohead protease [Hymenobacter sublimis]UPL50522.1 HK97 family phage prohead protease [Hymenobacter sublimis]